MNSNKLNPINIQWQLVCTRFDEWLKNDLFHFYWWLLLLLFILSIFIWWKKVDKSRLTEIVIFMGIVCIMILVLDELGEELALWDYPVDVFPLFPPISAINLASLPIFYAFIFQYFKTWKSFIIASLIMSIVSCFVLEPIFVLTGVYQMITWKSYYGLPLYFLIGVIARIITVRIYSIKVSKKVLE